MTSRRRRRASSALAAAGTAVVLLSGCHLSVKERPFSREDTSQVVTVGRCLVVQGDRVDVITQRTGLVSTTSGTEASLEFAEVGADVLNLGPKGLQSFSVYTANWQASGGDLATWIFCHLFGLAELVAIGDGLVFTFSAPVQLVRRLLAGSEDTHTSPAGNVRNRANGQVVFDGGQFHDAAELEDGRIPVEFLWRLCTSKSQRFTLTSATEDNLVGLYEPTGISTALREWLAVPGHGELETMADLADHHPIPGVRLNLREALAVRRERLEPSAAALRSAQESLRRGKLERAWEQAGDALSAAQELGETSLVTAAASFREQMRMPLIEARFEADRPLEALALWVDHGPAAADPANAVFRSAVSAIDRRLQAGAVEDATSITDLLARLMPGKSAEIDALQSTITTRSVEVAAELVEQTKAFKIDQYYKIEPLLRRAVALDPTNAATGRLLDAVHALRSRFAAAYVRNVFGQREGDGFIVYYTLANEKGELVAAPGTVSLRVFFDTPRGRGPSVELLRATVAEEDFEVREVGIGAFARRTLMHVLPRVTYARVFDALGVMDHLAVEVIFAPVGQEPMAGVGELQLPIGR